MKIGAPPQISRREFLDKSIKTAALAVSACSGVGWISACTRETHTNYDLVLKGGTVYDGLLAPPQQLDVGIKDGRWPWAVSPAPRCERWMHADSL